MSTTVPPLTAKTGATITTYTLTVTNTCSRTTSAATKVSVTAGAGAGGTDMPQAIRLAIFKSGALFC